VRRPPLPVDGRLDGGVGAVLPCLSFFTGKVDGAWRGAQSSAGCGQCAAAERKVGRRRGGAWSRNAVTDWWHCDDIFLRNCSA